MSTLQQIQELLKTISPEERAVVRQWVSTGSDGLFPGIEKTPGICGGEARIVGTRLPVWGLVESKREGSSDNEILLAYPALKLSDITNAWAYAAAYPTEIETIIKENSREETEREIAEHILEDKNAAALYG